MLLIKNGIKTMEKSDSGNRSGNRGHKLSRRQLLINGIKIAGIFVLYGFVTGCAPPFKRLPISHYLNQPSNYRLVEVLSGKSDYARMNITTQALETKGIPYKLEIFSTFRTSGKNITFEYGSGRKVVVISAHYDASSNSPGANDNASGIASIIDAYEMIKNNDSLRNLTVRFIIFGAEEIQRQGSMAYVETNKLDNIVGAVDIGMCGIGDSVAIWGVKEGLQNSLIVNALEKTLKETGIYYGIVGEVPGFYGDHMSFAKKGIPAVGFTIVSKDDEVKLKAYIKNPIVRKFSDVPSLFQTYHTPNDTPQTIQPSALKLTSDLIYKTVINLDSMLSSSPNNK
jgi:aminopeptidase YwaD